MDRFGHRMSKGDSAAKQRGVSGRTVGDSLVVLVIALATIPAAAFWSCRAGVVRAAEGAEPAAPRETLAPQDDVLRGPMALDALPLKKCGYPAFSPDGARLLISGRHLWNSSVVDMTSGKELFNGLRPIAMSPAGTRVVVLDGSSARLLDAVTERELAVLEGHGTCQCRFGGLHSVRFSPDGTKLVICFDTTTHVWDAVSGKELAVLEGRFRSSSFAFSPDGSRLAIRMEGGDGGLVWDLEAGKEVEIRGLKGQLRFSGDGRYVVAETHLVIRSSPLRPTLLEIFDATTGKSFASGLVPTRLSPAFMSPDGSRLFISRNRDSSNWSEFSLLDAATGEELAVLEGDQQRGLSAAFSPDSLRLATSDGTTTRLWDAATGSELAVLEGSPGQDGDFAFSFDGSRLATTGGGIRLWDVATGEELAVLEGDGGGAIAFSPDGTRLATLRGSTIRLWDAATGTAVAVSEQRESTPPRFGSEMLLFSPDGSRLATFDGTKTRLYALAGRDAPAIRERLAPIVAEWFSGDADGAAVSERLAAAKGTMAADDWREAAIIVLKRCRLRIEARQEERLAALPQALRSQAPEVLGLFAEAVDLAGDDGPRLNELVRDVELAAGEGVEIPAPLFAAATAATRRGVVLQPNDGALLDTLAHLLARQGQIGEATAIQVRALEHATADQRPAIAAFLAELEAKAGRAPGEK